MKTMILTAVVPLIVGPLSYLLMQGIKGISLAVDELPPVVKRLAVMLIAAIVTAVSHLAGVEVQCDPNAEVNCLGALDRDAISAIVGTAIAYAMHAYKKSREV